MSVLARPQWFVRSPPRHQGPGPAELSPLSAASAGSPSGGEGDTEGGSCGGYGGSLIMVQHECSADTERAAEAEVIEDEERLCSVVLDPLPTALLQSLGARGHVRMRRPPAAATSWPPSPPTLPKPSSEEHDDVRELVDDLVAVIENDADATLWGPEQARVAPLSPINEHRHRKKHRKARRESYDSEGRRKRRKRSTSSSSGSYCTTPGPGSEVEGTAPRVNPIFVWVTQSEESTITQVLCEDYDKRNRIRLTKTPQGWRAIPRTERLAVLQPNVPKDETVRSPSPNPEVSLDLSPGASLGVCASTASQFPVDTALAVDDTESMFPHDDEFRDEPLEENHVNEADEMHVDELTTQESLHIDELTTQESTHLDEQTTQESMHLDEQTTQESMHMDELTMQESQDDELHVEESHVDELHEETVDNDEEHVLQIVDDETSLSHDELRQADTNVMVLESEKIEQARNEIEEKFELDSFEEKETLVPESIEQNGKVDPDILETEVELKLQSDENVCKEEDESLERLQDDQSEHQVDAEEVNSEKVVSSAIREAECESSSTSEEEEPKILSLEDMLKIEPEKLEEEEMDAERADEKLAESESDLVPKKPQSATIIIPVVQDSTVEECADPREPPPAHASSLAVKKEPALEPAADLSSNKRRRRLSGLLPCRSPLRLPPLQARPLPSPVPLSTGERRTPSPAHQQQPCTLPLNANAMCGSQVPSPAHRHERHSPFLETLLSQPLSLESKRSSTSRDPPAKRQRSEDITLQSLLDSASHSVAPVVEEPAAPRSRLLELLTTTSPPRKPVESKRQHVPPPPPEPAPLDALAQLRHVLKEIHVPDPLLVPSSRFAAVLSSPAKEIPRLIRSPPPSTPDTIAVSLSRLQALLRRPDSELLAWAQETRPIPITKPIPPKSPISKPPPLSKTKPSLHITKVPNTKAPQSIPKSPSPKAPNTKTPPTPNPCTTLPWCLPRKPSSVPPPPPPPATADVLAAFHAMYGTILQQPNYFAPPFPTPHELSALWPGVMLSEVAKQTPPPTQTSQASAAKPRIVCKSLLELLATKPKHQHGDAPGATNLQTPSKQIEKRHLHHPQQQQQQQQEQPPPQTRDTGCPRLWHPLFGSQKSDSWSWRQVAVHGD